MLTEKTDEQLVQLAVNQDPEAFGEIVNRWERKIFALCYGMLGREDEAKDAAQEAFIAAFKNRKNVRSNPDIFEFKTKKGDGWARGKSYAQWVSDVLIVHTGIALIRTAAAQVETISVLDPIEPSPKGLGDYATEVAATYSEGKEFSFAVSNDDITAALGPNQNGADGL